MTFVGILLCGLLSFLFGCLVLDLIRGPMRVDPPALGYGGTGGREFLDGDYPE